MEFRFKTPFESSFWFSGLEKLAILQITALHRLWPVLAICGSLNGIFLQFLPGLSVSAVYSLTYPSRGEFNYGWTLWAARRTFFTLALLILPFSVVHLGIWYSGPKITGLAIFGEKLGQKLVLFTCSK